MCSRLAVLLALAASMAMPAIAAKAPRCEAYTDNFDDLGVALDPMISAIGTYNGVTYTGWDLSTASLVTGYTNGVYPSSGANDATAALSTDLIRLGTLSLTPYGSIIASPSTSFDLTSFSFGCGQFQANPQAPGVPVGCAISVTGFDISDQQIPEATFSYAPPDLLGSHMVLATLPSTFRGLKNVTLGVAASSLLVPTTLLDIDDVKHCNYS